MPRVQTFKKITKHIFENKEQYTAAMERGLVHEGDEIVILGDPTYNELSNLPSINGVTVLGDMDASDLGLQDELAEISTTEIIEMWNRIMNS